MQPAGYTFGRVPDSCGKPSNQRGRRHKPGVGEIARCMFG